MNVVTVRGLRGKPIQLRQDAAAAHTTMVAAARRDGLPAPLLDVYSGLRGRDKQARLWNAALVRYGSTKVARGWVAPPGNSEHELGIAADLFLGAAGGSKNAEALKRTSAYRWLAKNAGRFGFEPNRKINEPWHWVFRGARAAESVSGGDDGMLYIGLGALAFIALRRR